MPRAKNGMLADKNDWRTNSRLLYPRCTDDVDVFFFVFQAKNLAILLDTAERNDAACLPDVSYVHSDPRCSRARMTRSEGDKKMRRRGEERSERGTCEQIFAAIY